MDYVVCALIEFAKSNHGLNIDALNAEIKRFKFDRIAKYLGRPQEPFAWDNGHVKIKCTGSQLRVLSARLGLILNKVIKAEEKAQFFGSRQWFCFAILLKISATLMSPVIYATDLPILQHNIEVFLSACVELWDPMFIKPKFHSFTHYVTQIKGNQFTFLYVSEAFNTVK